MASATDIAEPGQVAVWSESIVAAETAPAGAVSWGAIFAGALAALAATTILLVLGTGLGLAAVSPWYGVGVGAATIGVSAIVWLVLVQWLASGVGGFLAGRLRRRWTGLHGHEVFFRDTAHGFLAWSLASVLGAALFALVTGTGVSGIARGGGEVAAAALSASTTGAAQPDSTDRTGYFADLLFRPADGPAGAPADLKTEALRILAHNIQNGQVVLTPADRSYLAQLVARQTGLDQAKAGARVDAVVQQLDEAGAAARQAADAARKRAAQLAIVTALAMVVGAFIASVAAAIGGGIRDEA